MGSGVPKANRTSWIRVPVGCLKNMKSSAKKRPALDATGHEQVGLWWPGVLQPIRPSSAVNNHLRDTAAQSIGPSEAVKPTTSAVVPPLGSSTYNLNAYHNQSLTAQWMATMPGALTVTSRLYPHLKAYAVSSHPLTLPSGAWESFGAHNVFRQSPQ